MQTKEPEKPELKFLARNSFYVVGEAEAVAGKISGNCTNTIFRRIGRGTIDDKLKGLPKKPAVSEIYVVESMVRKKGRSGAIAVSRSLGYHAPVLRALVIGYEGMKNVSQVVPFDYDIKPICFGTARIFKLEIYHPELHTKTERGWMC